MKLTAADFDRQYGNLSDDELLAIDPYELTDLARASYQREFARRSLDTHSSEPAESPAEPSPAPRAETSEAPEGWVEIAIYRALPAAEAARSALELADIPSTLAPGGGPGSEIHVLVAEDDRTLARTVIDHLPEANLELVEAWLAGALPGRKAVIGDMLAEDDIVAARLTLDGSQQAFCFARIAAGKVTQTWHNFDQLKRA